MREDVDIIEEMSVRSRLRTQSLRSNPSTSFSSSMYRHFFFGGNLKNAFARSSNVVLRME